jgi:surface antigen
MIMTGFRKIEKCPDPRDPAFCIINGGGLNHCIKGNSAGRIYKYSVLPNCTGYVHARAIQVTGSDAKLCRGNAENYWSYSDGFPRGSEPRVGSIMCYRKGKAGNASDGAGHVVFVEDKHPNGDVIVSESGWTGTMANGRYWRLRKIRRQGGTYSIGSAYTYQGSIYLYDDTRRPVFRLYNPNEGRHYFTENSLEWTQLAMIGWEYEGLAWRSPAEGLPVFQLYNKQNGDHLLTTNAAERDDLVRLGLRLEGVAFRSASAKEKPVHRLYNPNSGEHFYTLNADEKDILIRRGWKGEGVGFYALAK